MRTTGAGAGSPARRSAPVVVTGSNALSAPGDRQQQRRDEERTRPRTHVRQTYPAARGLICTVASTEFTSFTRRVLAAALPSTT